MMYYLYHIHRPDVNSLEEGYIGITNNTKRRWVEHRSEALQKRKNYPLYNAMRKSEVVFTILCIGEEDYIRSLEHTLRPQPGLGWNLSVGGSEVGGCVWKGLKRPAQAEQMKLKGFQKGNAAGTRPVYAEGFIFPSRKLASNILRVDYKTIYNRIKNPKFDYHFIPVED